MVHVLPLMSYLFIESLGAFDKIQEEKECWLWKKPPPESKKSVDIKSEDGTIVRVKRKIKNVSVKEKLLKGILCLNVPIIYPV